MTNQLNTQEKVDKAFSDLYREHCKLYATSAGIAYSAGCAMYDGHTDDVENILFEKASKLNPIVESLKEKAKFFLDLVKEETYKMEKQEALELKQKYLTKIIHMLR